MFSCVNWQDELARGSGSAYGLRLRRHKSPGQVNPAPTRVGTFFGRGAIYGARFRFRRSVSARAGYIPPLPFLQIALGAAGLEEVAGAREVVVLAAKCQRPRQLQPALQLLEDLDRRIKVLPHSLFITLRSIQQPRHIEALALPMRHVGFAGGLEAILALVGLAGDDQGFNAGSRRTAPFIFAPPSGPPRDQGTPGSSRQSRPRR